VGGSGVVGDCAGELVAEGFVEGFGGAAGNGVEGDEGAIFFNSYVFDCGHKCAGEAVTAVLWMDEEFGDFSAVPLVGRHVENQLNCGDDGVGCGVADDEDLALVSHGLREDFGAPPIEGILVGEGENEADTGTIMDGRVEERCELVEIDIECSGWQPGLEDVIRHWNVLSLGQCGLWIA